MYKVIIEYVDKTEEVFVDAIISLNEALVIQDSILEKANPKIEFVSVERMDDYELF
jgi:hypothetical protein